MCKCTEARKGKERSETNRNAVWLEIAEIQRDPSRGRLVVIDTRSGNLELYLKIGLSDKIKLNLYFR